MAKTMGSLQKGFYFYAFFSKKLRYFWWLDAKQGLVVRAISFYPPRLEEEKENRSCYKTVGTSISCDGVCSTRPTNLIIYLGEHIRHCTPYKIIQFLWNLTEASHPLKILESWICLWKVRSYKLIKQFTKNTSKKLGLQFQPRYGG